MAKGKLIVLEGIDGSGKSANYRRLCMKLDRDKIPYRQIVFPRYSCESSALIRMYLNGEFGAHPDDVNAYTASTFYAVDRYASYRSDWGKFYENGGLILSDRYTTSNAVHQGCKLPKEERDAYFRWLYEFEFDRLGLPRPDRVIYLDMPTEKSVELLRSRESSTNTTADIHEADTAYLAACRGCALDAVLVLGWDRIPCMEGNRLRGIEELHEEIWGLTKDLLK